jgi:hypothetical protein
VYPPWDKGGRWRAVWLEDGERQQCESVSEEKLAAKLEKVRQRLSTGASNMTRPGADLIAWYLNPDRLPVADRWSRKHADTQRRLCQRYAIPVINPVTCQDITVSHTQKIVNAAPTAGEGDRVHRMLSAMVGAGLKGGCRCAACRKPPRTPGSAGGPGSRRRTIHLAPPNLVKGRSCRPRAAAAVRGWWPAPSHNRVAAVSPQAWASFG